MQSKETKKARRKLSSAASAPSPYQSLEDESVGYAAWVVRHSARFRGPEWLAEDSLACIPTRARAFLDRNSNSSDGPELKVYIGPRNEDYCAFYNAGAIQLPLQYGCHGVAVKDVAGFMDRLRESDTAYRHAAITAVEVNGPVPATYTLVTRDSTVPTLTVTALSSGFGDAVNRSAWCIGANGSFASMSFYIELVTRRETLVGVKIDACIALERCALRAKADALEGFHGPRPLTSTVHCGESLGFLCARFRKATGEVVLHLSQSEFSAMNATFPILGKVLAEYTPTRLSATACFYDIPFKPLSWITRSDNWIGRVLLQTFVSTTTTREECRELPHFLLLTAVYVDL